MSKDHSFVSVIIPCFNEEENILRCIDSVKSQHYDGQFEIIVVDNGSIDNSVRIIKDRGIILVHAKKKGPAVTKNEGIRKAKGNIIVFIDADCIAHPDWLKNMIESFNYNETGCVAGEILPFEPKTKIEHFLSKKKHLSQSINVNHQFLPYAATANAAYRKEVFEQIGFFDEELLVGEDADMSWRMLLKTDYKLSYAPEALAYHPYETSLKALFMQKKRHAYGAVALHKKYKQFWPKQDKPLKTIYWEYHSIIKRLLTFSKDYLFNRGRNLNESHLQTILEAGWKFGLLMGALRYMVWYI